MENKINSGEENEIFDSQTSPLIHYQLPESPQTKFKRTNVPLDTLIRKCRPYVYIWAAGFIACVCGLVFGYQLAIIGGALLQVRNDFCFGILQSEVMHFSCACVKTQYSSQSLSVVQSFLTH